MLQILFTEDDDYDNNNDYDADAGAMTIVLLPAAEFIYRLGYCESSLGTITHGLACISMPLRYRNMSENTKASLFILILIAFSLYSVQYLHIPVQSMSISRPNYEKDLSLESNV